MSTNPQSAVTEFQIYRQFGEEYCRAASNSTAVNGFIKTGLWPVDRIAIQDCEFAPSSRRLLQVQINEGSYAIHDQ